jgi:hypothetical protein
LDKTPLELHKPGRTRHLVQNSLGHMQVQSAAGSWHRNNHLDSCCHKLED